MTEENSVLAEIRSILAATDFSADSRYAVLRAGMLATSTGAEKGVLLHVVEDSWIDRIKPLLSRSPEIETGIVSEAARRTMDLADEVRQQSGFALEPRVTRGSVVEEIIAAGSESDLLVLGGRGLHPVRALALGTTSLRLLARTGRPVLVVKRKPHRPYRNVLVAIDFSPGSAKILSYGHALAPTALITLVHVFEPFFEKSMFYPQVSDEMIEEHRTKAYLESEFQMTGIMEAAGMGPERVNRVIEHGHAPARLPELALRWNPDLVVVGKHGRSRIEELLLGSVTRHVLAQSKCDVLVAG